MPLSSYVDAVKDTEFDLRGREVRVGSDQDPLIR
jgi:hypothetical protein